MTSDMLATLKVNAKIEVYWDKWRIASYIRTSDEGQVIASRNGAVMEFDPSEVRLV